MKVKVKRYMISHEGQIYKEGEVVTMENKQAKKLVAKSKGTLEIVHADEVNNDEAAAEETVETAEDETEFSGGCELPDVDALAAVGGKKNKK